MPQPHERRYNPGVVEVRAKPSTSNTIGGYAAVFNRYSDNLGGFIEQVDRGFFNKSNGDGWPGVIARYNHDDNFLLGTTGAGTLRLSIDDTGLSYDVDLPNARADIRELVDRGDVRQSSFAFQVFQDDWDMTDQGVALRTLISGRLIDVAPVNTPAYPDATVGLRSLALKFDASYDDVAALARDNELRRLFRRSDLSTPSSKTTLSGPEALAQLLGKTY
jgi:HK97 family phage prohead protease